MPRAMKSQGFQDHCNHKVYTKVYYTDIGSRYNYQNTIYNAIVHITQLYNSTTCRKVQSINYMMYTIW